MSSVAYKKGNWMRYSLWALATICIGFLIWTFISTLNSEISSSVPEGYRFAVTDDYGGNSRLRTTYYVYEDKILAEDESIENNTVNRSVLVYDGVNTSSLQYNPEEVGKICQLGICYECPKVLPSVKKLIANKTGREYVRL